MREDLIHRAQLLAQLPRLTDAMLVLGAEALIADVKKDDVEADRAEWDRRNTADRFE